MSVNILFFFFIKFKLKSSSNKVISNKLAAFWVIQLQDTQINFDNFIYMKYMEALYCTRHSGASAIAHVHSRERLQEKRSP